MARAGGTRAVRLLHLSDIHFRGSKSWDARPVLQALTEFVAETVAAEGPPDLVAITGDLAYSGKAAEYKLARQWLDQLWKTLGSLPKDRLLLVPGNHDVDRGKVDFTAESVQASLLSGRDQERIATVLGDKKQRTVLLQRHAGYARFVKDWFGAAQPLPWWRRMIDIDGVHLHVAGLDSAWMAACDQDSLRLLIGRYQLTETVETAEEGGAAWRLALVHHPWDDLAEFDRHPAQDTVRRHCDVLLRGHLHHPHPQHIHQPDPTRNCLELPTGCVYETSQYPNTFQWLELSPPPAKRVRVRFCLWHEGAWIIDKNRGDDGWWDVDLTAPPSPTPEPVPAGLDLGKYLDDLWAETAYIDIRGLATGRAQANRFPIEELYIELAASGGTGDDALERKIGPERRDTPLAAALKHTRLVIIGDPGCGKTTFLRWVAHCLAADRLGRTADAARSRLGLDRARLPVLVPVAGWLDYIDACERQNAGRTLKNGAGWLPEYLGARAADAHQGLDADAFRTLLAAGECFILLDGLDEAPDQQRRLRAVAIIESLARAYRDCPLVVTSRPAAYQDKAVLTGFARREVDALDPAAIDGFLARWTRTLNPDRPERAEREHRELAGALASRPEIRRMARNTVMLTALAVVHWNEKRLPEQRAELYDAILKWLLEAREQRPGREKPQRCRQHLSELALAMQADGKGRQVQVPRRWAAERLAARFGADAEATDRAEAFLAEEEVDSGIIVRRSHDLKFWHLTFQEYLAAQALAGKADADRNTLLLGGDGPVPVLYRPEWRETVLLLAGVLCQQGEDKTEGLVAAVLDQLGAATNLAGKARAAGMIGRLVSDLQPFGYRPADPRYTGLLQAAMAVFDARLAVAIPVRDRVDAADALALAGDPRLGWTSPARWVDLPGGAFLMGAQKDDPQGPGFDPQAYDDEAPVRRVAVEPFRMARFPVTVEEYAEFVEAEDAGDPVWWRAGGEDQGALPQDWDDQQTHPSRPIVGVSWFQARAFCAWLTVTLSRPRGAWGEILLAPGQVVRLPSEAEWEYAARGCEGRSYPWGAEPPDNVRANTSEAEVGHASQVGIFPAGATPEGVMDLAGNVWEWCDGKYDESDDTSTSARVLRGGCWSLPQAFARSAYRFTLPPSSRGSGIGFRVVSSSPILEH